MRDSPPALFDRRLYRTRLDRAAPRYAEASFLKARVSADILDTLSAILRDFPLMLDLGARDGTLARLLRTDPAFAGISGRVGTILQSDLSPRQLAGLSGPRLVLDEEQLPFAPASLNLVTSALGLHAVNDLPGVLVQIRQALAPDGLFVGAFFGGASLTELRQVLLEAEVELTGGAGPRVAPFAEGFDGAALLQRAGFMLPVADVDRFTVRYASPLALLKDLRAMGETRILLDGSPRPLRRDVLMRAMALYVERFAEADGRVPATVEILTLSGWAAHESQQKPLRPGSAKTRLADALGVKEQKL
ncbi:MAG: class I SAM-dependent methyltransferase [Asticcacaulis sp.]